MSNTLAWAKTVHNHIFTSFDEFLFVFKLNSFFLSYKIVRNFSSNFHVDFSFSSAVTDVSVSFRSRKAELFLNTWGCTILNVTFLPNIQIRLQGWLSSSEEGQCARDLTFHDWSRALFLFDWSLQRVACHKREKKSQMCAGVELLESLRLYAGFVLIKSIKKRENLVITFLEFLHFRLRSFYLLPLAQYASIQFYGREFYPSFWRFGLGSLSLNLRGGVTAKFIAIGFIHFFGREIKNEPQELMGW